MDEKINSDKIKEYVELIEKLESDRIERTISLTDTDKYCEAICAFANDLPNHSRPGYFLTVPLFSNPINTGVKVQKELP